MDITSNLVLMISSDFNRNLKVIVMDGSENYGSHGSNGVEVEAMWRHNASGSSQNNRGWYCRVEFPSNRSTLSTLFAYNVLDRNAKTWRNFVIFPFSEFLSSSPIPEKHHHQQKQQPMHQQQQSQPHWQQQQQHGNINNKLETSNNFQGHTDINNR